LHRSRVAGLDPRGVRAEIRASDNGQAGDDSSLRADRRAGVSDGGVGGLRCANSFKHREGRLRVGATTLTPRVLPAIVRGDNFPADQADIRVVIASTTWEPRPVVRKLAVFLGLAPQPLNRTVDVAARSSWLAGRAIRS